MMKYLFYATLIIVSFCSYGQDYQKELLAYQAEQNAEFRNPEKSPLTKSDLKKFKGLEFFHINEKYRVLTKVVRTPESNPFLMETTTERRPVYQKYADLIFEIDGVEYKLEVYQNHDLMNKPEFKDYLFLPFRDLTNGEETYGGGRYISLSIPEGNEMVIDFNKAYNPYCAYNSAYSCPIVPVVNRLNLRVEAGVKGWGKNQD
jgi:uncharacterized protein